MSYKVEDMKYWNEYRAYSEMTPGEYYFREEYTLTTQEKIAVIDDILDGAASKIIKLAEDYETDYKNGKIKKTPDHRRPNTASLRAWLCRKQKELQMDLVDTGYFIGSISVKMGYNEYIQRLDTKEDRDMFIDRAFHRVLMNCKDQEGAYFRKHDPYTVLQEQIVDHPFLFMLPCRHILSGGDELEIGTLDNHRKPTMEELQLILQNLDDMQTAAKTVGSKLVEQAPWLPFTTEEN